MNFLNFRDFSKIFRIYFRFKSLKIIKKRIKRGYIFVRDPRECDMACKATWQSHVDPRERVRGTELTRGFIYIYSYYIRL